MNFKKKGLIKNISNKTCFLVLSNTLTVATEYETKKGYTRLIFYKNCTEIKRLEFKELLDLKPFTAVDCVILNGVDKVYFIDFINYSVKTQSFANQLVTKIDQIYFIPNKLLHHLETGKQIELEKSLYINPFYYHQMPKNGYIYGYTKMEIYDADKTCISCFSIHTGKELWSYSTSPIKGEPQLLSFIGNNSQQLWLFAGTQVVVLAIETGKQLATIGQANRNQQDTTEQVAKHTILGACSLEKTKLIGLWDKHYQEVSMKTFKLKHVDLHTEFDLYDISCMYACLDTKYIYFYDSNWLVSKPRGKVAVLDRKTLKIVWCWDILKELGSAPLHIEVVDNQLYVLDNGLTLHVFEAPN